METILWVLARIVLVGLLLLFAFLFENQFKEIWKARNLTEIQAAESEKSFKEYKAYNDLSLSVTRTRNAYVDLLQSVKIVATKPLPKDLERHKSIVQVSISQLDALRVKLQNRDVLLNTEIEQSAIKFLEFCDTAMTMQNEHLNRNIKSDFGRLDAQKQLLGKVAEELLTNLKGAVKQLTISLKQRS